MTPMPRPSEPCSDKTETKPVVIGKLGALDFRGKPGGKPVKKTEIEEKRTLEPVRAVLSSSANELPVACKPDEMTGGTLNEIRSSDRSEFKGKWKSNEAS